MTTLLYRSNLEEVQQRLQSLGDSIAFYMANEPIRGGTLDIDNVGINRMSGSAECTAILRVSVGIRGRLGW
jgi:hypothetical protein